MIYCVEDDDDIRNLVLYTLKASGMEARGFSSAREFWPAMEEELPQLVLLDIMLPGEDGLSILNRIRNQEVSRTLPVIMTTAKGTEYDKVIGLDAGADDYLVKPFGMMEMVSRVKAVLRRYQEEKSDLVYHNGTIIVDSARHIASSEGKTLELTLKEYDLLVYFLSHIERAVSREELLNIVWGMNYIGESRTVDVHVGTLRTKLGNNGLLIETVRGVGYKMTRSE